MIGGIFDRYWFAKIAVRFAAIVSIIPAILALENVRRLLADVEKSSDALLLLIRLSVALIPEHLSIAVPVALMLGSALAVRQMTLRGEWQIAATAGMSRLRIMAAPLAFAALAASAQFAIRFDLRPAGERALDTIYHELQAGDHGLPLPVGQAIELDASTTLFVGGIGEGSNRHLEDVTVRRGEDSFSAPRADIGFSPDGGVRLRLLDGVGLSRAGTGQPRAIHFDRMDFSGKPPGIGLVDDDPMHRFDRLSGASLLEVLRNGPATDRQNALTALVMRMDSVLFCLLIPWFAIPLGKPPRRKESAAGVFVSIVLVVLHLKLSASIEMHSSAQILQVEALNLCLWVAVAAGLIYLEEAHGEGAVDRLASWLAAPIRQLRKRRAAIGMVDREQLQTRAGKAALINEEARNLSPRRATASPHQRIGKPRSSLEPSYTQL